MVIFKYFVHHWKVTILGTIYLASGHIDELFKENLYLNLATKRDPQALRGRILTHLAGPSESTGDAVMLKSEYNLITGRVGHGVNFCTYILHTTHTYLEQIYKAKIGTTLFSKVFLWVSDSDLGCHNNFQTLRRLHFHCFLQTLTFDTCYKNKFNPIPVG